MAYALDEIGSEQYTGSASRLGSRVSLIWFERIGFPTSSRLGSLKLVVTSPDNARRARGLPLP